MTHLPQRMQPSKEGWRVIPNRYDTDRSTLHEDAAPRLLVGLYEVAGLPPPPDPGLFWPEQFVMQLKELGISIGTHPTVEQLLGLIDAPDELNEQRQPRCPSPQRTLQP